MREPRQLESKPSYPPSSLPCIHKPVTKLQAVSMRLKHTVVTLTHQVHAGPLLQGGPGELMARHLLGEQEGTDIIHLCGCG